MLEHTQILFANALADSTHAAALLGELDTADPRTAERIDLYRGNVSAVWEKALANAFPVIKQLVGEEFFDGLARAYGRACPSRSGDLNEFGDRFAEFLVTFAHAQSLPYLSDVARLEWLAHRAHYAADAAPIDRARLAAMPPETLLATCFAVHPACAWIASTYPIATLWQAHQPDASVALPATLEQSEHALVVRPKWRVEVVLCGRAEIAALAALRAGADMASAIEAAMQVDASFDFAGALLRWIACAILVERDS
jgi:hypothetical protein